MENLKNRNSFIIAFLDYLKDLVIALNETNDYKRGLPISYEYLMGVPLFELKYYEIVALELNEEAQERYKKSKN